METPVPRRDQSEWLQFSNSGQLDLPTKSKEYVKNG